MLNFFIKVIYLQEKQKMSDARDELCLKFGASTKKKEKKKDGCKIEVVTKRSTPRRRTPAPCAFQIINPINAETSGLSSDQ